MTVEDSEGEVIAVLDHQSDQEPVVTNVVGFDDHLRFNRLINISSNYNIAVQMMRFQFHKKRNFSFSTIFGSKLMEK